VGLQYAHAAAHCPDCWSRAGRAFADGFHPHGERWHNIRAGSPPYRTLFIVGLLTPSINWPFVLPLVGFRWFKLYERAANICHSFSQSTTTRMNRVRQAFEPSIRRAFHLYWRWARGVTLGVRGLVIDKDQRIFLVTHTYVPGWQLPGGGVEPGETMAEALARELVEEGNIEILESPVLHGLFFNSRVSQRDHVALFIVRSFRQQRVPVPNREIAAHGFFSLDALPENTTPGTRARIAEVILGAPLSERW
jgi:8-oxo-dGTP pyrophosphatase MutT (NUDIX family)